MRTICIESPLAGDFARNIAYARACLRYCLEQGVSPYASHLLLPQVYDGLSWRTPLAKKLRLSGVPFTVILDRDGTVAMGNAMGPLILSEVERLLAQDEPRAYLPFPSAAPADD